MVTSAVVFLVLERKLCNFEIFQKYLYEKVNAHNFIVNMYNVFYNVIRIFYFRFFKSRDEHLPKLGMNYSKEWYRYVLDSCISSNIYIDVVGY